MKQVIKLTESDIIKMVRNTILEFQEYKPELHILWLDDKRNPEIFLKKKHTSGAGTRTMEFYNKLMAKYNVSFTWVKNIREFQEYVINNGLPKLISFDRDLTLNKSNPEPSGEECAKWLVNYCQKTHQSIPRYFVHSANKNGQKNIPNIIGDDYRFITESVYFNNADTKSKKLNLIYNKGSEYSKGNLFAQDKLKTDKMDVLDGDTYTRTLKGGITSYNITDIKGTNVMHYFKEFFDNVHSTIDVQTDQGVESYQMDMKPQEFQEFMEQFKSKVEKVIIHAIQTGQIETNNITGVSIYPIPSRSGFNKKMAQIISTTNILGLPITIINDTLFKKDLSKLSKDNDFINKNKEFYDKPFYKNKKSDSNLTRVDNALSRLNAFRNAVSKVNEINDDINKLLSTYNNLKTTIKNNPDYNTQKRLNALATCYMKYYDDLYSCFAGATYNKIANGISSVATIRPNLILTRKKSSNPQSIEIWRLIKPLLHGRKSKITNKAYKLIDIQYYDAQKFQIKNLSNTERMGLKNYYNVNDDKQIVEQELQKIKNTVFVIFDDNISGGATLSDICYQAANLGIQNIIPITFGTMNKKNTIGVLALSTPDGGDFNY